MIDINWASETAITAQRILIACLLAVVLFGLGVLLTPRSER